MKKMNESLQRKTNGGTSINSNKIVLSEVAILGPTMIGQKIVDVSKYTSVKVIGSFNKKIKIKKVGFVQ